MLCRFTLRISLARRFDSAHLHTGNFQVLENVTFHALLAGTRFSTKFAQGEPLEVIYVEDAGVNILSGSVPMLVPWDEFLKVELGPSRKAA
jgi:hypothetical protein